MTHTPTTPNKIGITKITNINVEQIIPYINWKYFQRTWRVINNENTLQLIEEAKALLTEDNNISIHAIIGLYKAKSDDEDIVIYNNKGRQIRFPMLRQQNNDGNICLSLVDYLSKDNDWIGTFACSVKSNEDSIENEYLKIMWQTLCDRVVEATAEWLHEQVREYYWGFSAHENLSINDMLQGKYQGIRPAIGYPSLPDQSIIWKLKEVLPLDDIGIEITNNGAMLPTSSICGFIIAHPHAKYFRIDKISNEQAEDYAKRRGFDKLEMMKYISHITSK